MLTLESLALQRGGHYLIEDATLSLPDGCRAFVTGRNGCGKSSLFALILGQLEPDRGRIVLPGNTRVAHMAQDILDTSRTALDYVLDGHQPFRQAERALARAEQSGDDQAMATAHAELDALSAWSLPNQAEQLLAGLGFQPGDSQRKVAEFSGGWQIRLNLARALIQPSDLLLLDEPTNHLDLDALVWLEDWLLGYQGTLLIISHDRDFMDRLATHILHVENRRIQLYTGNYSQFEEARAQKLAQQQALYEQQQRRIRDIEDFVRRFGAKATKARQAQSRMKELERMERIAPAHVDSPFTFSIPCHDKLSAPLLALEQVTAGYPGKPVIAGISLTLQPESRLGLLGHNGAGKSTLIRTLAGALPVLAGQRTEGAHLRIGYFAQHQLEQLDPEASPLLHLQRIDPKASEAELRRYLGSFAFSGDMADSPVRHFSGGEKARLVLAGITWQAPNLLLLDEPTNHLDIEMRHALILALESFAGAVVLVSHDRHLLRALCDDYLLVEDGRVRPWTDSLDAYERHLLGQFRARRQSEAPPASRDNAPGETAEARKARKQKAARMREATRPLRKRIEEAEARMARLGEELAAVTETLGDNALYDPARKDDLTRLLNEQARLKQALEETESEWLDASEALEDLLAQLEREA
ncbi:ATP-binding cassette domain-containing protein [Hahella sp. SMD15-11]|uniref:Probable ATP-binding protein YheS n=1 Tax=Thermohahella caldifontis TaxID=3142973 RepID=A0AB39US20_9GAMM